MSINFWAVIVCGILSMVIGSTWYGFIFGKTWTRLIGVELPTDPEKKKEMDRKAGPLYGIQLIVSLVQIFFLAIIIHGSQASGLVISLWIYVGFILPMIIGGSLWNNDSKKDAWTKFLLNAGCQFILFFVYGLILGYWR